MQDKLKGKEFEKGNNVKFKKKSTTIHIVYFLQHLAQKAQRRI